MNKTPIYYNETQMEEIQHFIKDQWGHEDNGVIGHEIQSQYVHTDVLTLGSEDKDKVLVTFGVGARKMYAPLPGFSRVEFVMYASNKFSTRVDGEAEKPYLTAIAELQHLSKYPFENNTWFGPGHTINATRIFTEEFGYQYFLFIKYCEEINLSGIGNVHFLIAIPVYEEERDWMASNDNGSQRFLEKYIEEFERNGNRDNMFKIDIQRSIIIPHQLL